MGAAFQGQTYPAVPTRHSALQVQGPYLLGELGSPALHEEPSVQLPTGPSAMQAQVPDLFDEWIDLHRTPDPEQQDFSDEPTLPTLLGRVGREEASAQSLPHRRSSEEVFALRRRRRAQTATIVSSQMLTEALASDWNEEHILRPPRVILTTPEGIHSICLPQDCEARLHYVQAGLPAGPVLAKQESCAICLDELQTGERVQLMANCRHVFHAACIKTLLHSRMSSWMAGDFPVPCPLCRGPLVAASMSQIPRRERRRAITLNSTWFATEMPSTEPNSEDEDALNASEVVVPTKPIGCNCRIQSHSASLRRAGTAPLERSDNAGPILVQRAASSHLEALGVECETTCLGEASN